MVINPSFLDIQHFSDQTEENSFFTQYTNQNLAKRYDSNYMQLHYNPTLSEFVIIEDIQKEDQLDKNQQHIKINWPENTGIFVDLLDYLNKENYQLGKEELMLALPNQLHVYTINQNLTYTFVDENHFKDFLTLNYKEDLSVDEEFAALFQSIYAYQFAQENTKFLLVTLEERPVASLMLHISENFIEIDHVLTDRDYRNQGIASSMFHYVMREVNINQKPLILVVDAEDTPKEFYEKIGFRIISSQISILKERLD